MRCFYLLIEITKKNYFNVILLTSFGGQEWNDYNHWIKWNFSKIGNTFLPFGIIALVAVVLPLPVALLDAFFVVNITLSLLILMVALHTQRPLDFSSFPNLLLIATVLRLGLNVASTRIVLKEGHTGPDAAGQVIEAFGDFIVSGNYAVGLFVFSILVIINLVVILKVQVVFPKSQRVSHGCPPWEANGHRCGSERRFYHRKKQRKDVRRLLKRQTSGSMDGASKFVSDAIAGILILAINVIGGLIMGLLQHRHRHNSTILYTIGDR